MKRASMALVMLICLISWMACKKKTNSSPDVTQPAGMHAKINGVTWNAQYINKVDQTGGGHYSIEFDGPDSITNETLSIELADFTGKGVHTINTTSADKAYYSIDTGSIPVPMYATSGQVTITALNDSVVQGTFSFTAGAKTITDGTFNISF